MAKVSMRDVKREMIPTDAVCEQCGAKMVKRWGKRGYFLACSAYPKCRFTREVEGNGEKKEETDARCEQCGGPMVVKNGKFGRFLACSNYPTCKSTRPWETGVRCPQEGCEGVIVERRTRERERHFTAAATTRHARLPCGTSLSRKNAPSANLLSWLRSRARTELVRCPKKGCGYRAAGTEEHPRI